MEVDEQDFESKMNEFCGEDEDEDESDEYHEDDLPDLVINAHNQARFVIWPIL